MAKVIGNHVYFLRSGLVSPVGGTGATGATGASVTVSKTVKPDHDPPTNWTNYELPECSEIAPSVNVNREQSYAPNASGIYVKKDDIVLDNETLFVATFERLNLLAYELLFGTGSLSAATQAQIMSGTMEVAGWAWLMQRDNAGNTILDAEFWAKATIQGVNFARAISRPQISFAMIEAGALGEATVSNIGGATGTWA